MHVEEFLKLDEVRSMLAHRYREGVSAAVAGYQHARADEDTVTGALGQALLGRGAFALSDGRVATWSTQYTRFGTAGKSDPAETRYGADGIFEIELTDDEGITTRKSLLFQAKKEAYTFGSSRLRRQARQIGSVPGGGIVIDYRRDGFVAVDATAVARADRERLRPTALGDVLANEFVGCIRGSSAYFYDPDRETINMLTANGSFVVQRLPVANRIRTRFMQFTLS